MLSLVVMLTSVGISLPAKAEGEWNVILVEGQLTDESMMNAIEEYLWSKTWDSTEVAAMLADIPTTSAMSLENSGVSEFVSDAMNRNTGLSNLESRMGAAFEDIDIFFKVQEIVSQTSDCVVVDVCESTVIEYLASSEAENVDVMGYETEHIMTLAKTNDSYQVIADSYDERLTTGVCSADLINTPVEDVFRVSEDVLGELTAVKSQVVLTSNSTYNVNAAITYANTYCGIPEALKVYDSASYGSELGGAYSNSGYNSQYADYEDADCANFVSQCLHAGGLSQVSGVWAPGTGNWINAKSLYNYLTRTRSYGEAYVASDYSNVYPGNPVLWIFGGRDEPTSPSGHQMICTGYNGAGMPVVNAHTGDLFRYPLNLITEHLNDVTNDSPLITIYLVNGDVHTHPATNYIYNSFSHYRICLWCQRKHSNGAHTVISGFSGEHCSVCGYTGPFTKALSEN